MCENHDHSVSRRGFLKTTLAGSALLVANPLAGTAFAAPPQAGLKPATPEVKDVSSRVIKATPLPLDAVRVTGGPLKAAQDADAKFLLTMDLDRIMYWLRVRAGLQGKGEGGLTGWDAGETRQLTGHIAGHYLSAVSYMYAATGNPEFKRRADYLVSEMAAAQDKQGDGYLGAIMGNAPAGARGAAGGGAAGAGAAAGAGGAGARRGRGAQSIEDGKALFEAVSKGEIRSGGFDLNGMWSPWYTEHKIFAGLRDAYRFTGNKQALAVEVKFAAWVEGILKPLTEAQDQQMLATEFGGMNETLADLYADTGDKRWLDLSYKFEHYSFTDPLARHEDILPGKHINMEVAKILGSVARYAYTGDARDIMAASYYYDDSVEHHTFATGGQGRNEYFFAADAGGANIDGRTCESCNVYNMLKFSRSLFSYNPDAHYADYIERAMYNHQLASIDPSNGIMCYMVPVGQGLTHEYQGQGNRSFTCCVGTGMENHALVAYGQYFSAGKKLWVNFYAPTEGNWAEQGVKLTMDTDAPLGEKASIKLAMDSPKELTLMIRRPYWVTPSEAIPFSVKVNGESVVDESGAGAGGGRGFGRAGRGGAGGRGGAAAGRGGAGGRGGAAGGRGGPGPMMPVSTYVEVTRTFKGGDTIEVTLPKSLRLEPTHDNPNLAAVMWGPLVLGGDMGRSGNSEDDAGSGARPEAPVFVSDGAVSDWLKPVSGTPGEFKSAGAGRPGDMTFKPFYQMAQYTYGIYFNHFTNAEWATGGGIFTEDQVRERNLQQATVDLVQPGQMQAERDSNYQGAGDASPIRVEERAGRKAKSWFSFEVKVDPAHPAALSVTSYTGGQPADGSKFEVLVDGQKLADEKIDNAPTPGFIDKRYDLPAAAVQGKQKVTVKFQAASGSEVSVFGIRSLRTDAIK